MVNPYKGPVDSFHDQIWTQVEVYGQNSKKSLPINKTAIFTSQKEVTIKIYSGIEGERGNPGGSVRSKGEGVLFPTIFGKEEDRRLTSCVGFKKSQQEHKNRGLQNGESAVHTSGSEPGRLDALSRFIRRLPTYSNSSRLSKIPPICHQQKPLPISVPSFRHLVGSQDIYQGPPTLGCIPQGKGSTSPPLFGRHPALGRRSRNLATPSENLTHDSPRLRLASQLEKEQLTTHTKHGIPGSRSEHQIEHGTTPSGEDSASSTEDVEITISEGSSSQNLLECARVHGCNPAHGAMVTMAHESPPKLLSEAVGWSIDAPDHYYLQTNEAISMVVDTLDQPQEIQTDSSPRSDNSHLGCLSERLGSSLSRSSSTGPMAVPGPGYSIEYTGTQGSFPGPHGICTSPQREERAYSDGQQGGSVLHPEARGYQELHTDGGSPPYLGMGTGTPGRFKSNICSCGTEHVSRLLESRNSFEQRMVSESPGLFSSYGNMGSTRDRLSSYSCEYEVSEVSVQSIFPFSRRDRLSNSPLELQVGVHIPANSANCEIPVQASEIFSHGNRGNPSLAEKTMVHDPIAAQPSTSNPPSGNSGFAISRPISTSSSRETASDSMEVERVRLREQGCSQEVISTLMQARKSTTNTTYTRIWNQFFTMAQQKGWDPIAPEPSQILEFLQSGINKGLSSSTLKVQVSALSAKTGTRWALHPLVIQFLRACLKIKPPKKPVFPSWDLSVVLEAFTNPPFTPSESISLWDLTLKLSFLIAITSARRVSEIQALMASEPYLVFFPDKVVLRPSDHFIPKVATSFHYNQDIVLPSFTNDQGEPHPLDVKTTIISYLAATNSFRKTDTLMVIPHGNKRGQAATSHTIASWLVKSIKKAYSMRHMAIPEGIRAHSTRAVATSWAAYCRVSPETICKAATWSSRHTFISHYRVDSAHLAMADFGRSVVRANSSAL